MSIVQNKLSKRCQTIRHVGNGVYEYGWLAYTPRDRSKDYFNRAGAGTLEEAQEWLAKPIVGARKRIVVSIVQGG